jgi:hypothetical protein
LKFLALAEASFIEGSDLVRDSDSGTTAEVMHKPKSFEVHQETPRNAIRGISSLDFERTNA